MTAATAAATQIRVEIHICDERRSYFVTFEGPDADDRAVAFMEDRMPGGAYATGTYGNHAFFIDEVPDPDGLVYGNFPKVIDFLYPTCEHGLSASLCMGPQHYPSYEQEMRGEF